MKSGKAIYNDAVPLDFNGNISDEDIEQRVNEILERDDSHNPWKPYMFLKEVVGVDLINNHIDDIGQTIIALQIKLMGEVKDSAMFRRIEEYLDEDVPEEW